MKYRYHPITEALYLFSMIFLSLILLSPISATISLLCPLGLAIISKPKKIISRIPLVLSLTLLLCLTNPIFSQNGDTALLFINGHRITAEALLYGFFMGLAISDSILVFSILNQALDSDRMYCLLGRLSPRLSLVFSMTLGLVPNMRRKYSEILSAARLSGGLDESTAPRRLRSHLQIFSMLVTNSLEGGIERGDSMQARGYGTGKRTMYTKFKFAAWDTAAVILISALDMTAIVSYTLKGGFSFYPNIYSSLPKYGDARRLTATAVFAFAILLLSLLPTLFFLLRSLISYSNSPRRTSRKKERKRGYA